MTQQIALSDARSADDERYQIGYASELFEAVENLMPRGGRLLDAGCGAGRSAQPLVARGFKLTGIDPDAEMLALAQTRLPNNEFVLGNVEQLPFADKMFDGALSAQAFHYFDAERALAEMMRVVKPGGSIAIWWKLLVSDEPIRGFRSTACAQAGVPPTQDPLRGGFGAFYAAPFAQHSVRVLPFRTRFRIDDWLGYERSRAAVRADYGERADAYLAALRNALVAKYCALDARMDVRYTQFLYVGRTAE